MRNLILFGFLSLCGSAFAQIYRDRIIQDRYNDERKYDGKYYHDIIGHYAHDPSHGKYDHDYVGHYQHDSGVGKYEHDYVGHYEHDPHEGRYYHDYTGHYVHDESGSYNHDDHGAAGQYEHNDNPYVHHHNPYDHIHDARPPYEHIPDARLPYEHKPDGQIPYKHNPDKQIGDKYRGDADRYRGGNQAGDKSGYNGAGNRGGNNNGAGNRGNNNNGAGNRDNNNGAGNKKPVVAITPRPTPAKPFGGNKQPVGSKIGSGSGKNTGDRNGQNLVGANTFQEPSSVLFIKPNDNGGRKPNPSIIAVGSGSSGVGGRVLVPNKTPGPNYPTGIKDIEVNGYHWEYFDGDEIQSSDVPKYTPEPSVISSIDDKGFFKLTAPHQVKYAIIYDAE